MLSLIPPVDFPVALSEFQRVIKKDRRLLLVKLYNVFYLNRNVEINIFVIKVLHL